MDYSKFLDEKFDVKEWVNDAFKSQKDGNINNDQYATTLVMKLQMFIQEVNNVIEEGCQQAVQNLPRVTRELDAVRQEASLLQDQMRIVKEDIQKVEQDTSSSMQMLLKIDGIKSRMQAASDALKEADNWTTLSADVDEVFESEDVHAIAEKLLGMKQSLQMLKGVPDYEEKCKHLESLKNRLEATLSPKLVAALNSQKVESAQMYVKMFTDIDRLPQLIKYYHNCQKTHLIQSWKNIQDTHTDSSLVERLAEFYDNMLSTWHTQMKWCGQVFQEPIPVVCDLMREALVGLEPPLVSCIATHIKDVDQPIESLIELKQNTDRFAKNIETALETKAQGTIYLPCVEKLTETIYSPYQPYVARYGNLEAERLATELENIALDHGEVMESVRLLGESVPKLFNIANKANERCLQFTNGCGYVMLIKALQDYFENYLKEFQRVLGNLREKCKLNSSTMDSEDWSLFQHSLRIIQTCGELIKNTEKLDQSLVSSIVSSLTKFLTPMSPLKEAPTRVEHRKNPFHNYSVLLLAKTEDQLAVESLITKLEEGDTPSVLEDIKNQLCSLSELVHKFAFDIVFAPLKQQLANLSTMEVWSSESVGVALTSNLPTFSLSPQEYITKIGQYLMTLPQQLEPFTMQDNPAVMVALKHGKLPYTNEQELPEHLADLWLESIARGTMHTYSEQILRIRELSQYATKQLTTDIDYLSNVLDDIELETSDVLKNIKTLLETPEDDYSDVAETLPKSLASTIANMRHLRID